MTLWTWNFTFLSSVGVPIAGSEFFSVWVFLKNRKWLPIDYHFCRDNESMICFLNRWTNFEMIPFMAGDQPTYQVLSGIFGGYSVARENAALRAIPMVVCLLSPSSVVNVWKAKMGRISSCLIWINSNSPRIPSGKHTKNYRKSPFSMGKSTISMAMFNSYVKNYQRVKQILETSPYHSDVAAWRRMSHGDPRKRFCKFHSCLPMQECTECTVLSIISVSTRWCQSCTHSPSDSLAKRCRGPPHRSACLLPGPAKDSIQKSFASVARKGQPVFVNPVTAITRI